MRVLGVDPGSIVTGWGVLEGPPSHPRVVECGAIRLPTKKDLALRLDRLYTELSRVVDRLEPESAAVEKSFHGASARSSIQLAHARGVVLAVLGRTGMSVAEYAPAEVKLSVAGNGRAEKTQVARMVIHLLGRGVAAGPMDVTDALAVAVCHMSRAGFELAVARSTRQR